MTQEIRLGNLTIQLKESDDGNSITYTFSGDVDEYFKQSEVPRVQKSSIIFDLESVKNFNSCGIREWISLVKDIGNLGQLTFVKCSVTMIDQINMVPASLGNARIESFYAPYYRNCQCKGEREENSLLEISKVEDDIQKAVAPNVSCDTCGESLEFDALEESYFLFAGSAADNKAS